MQEPKQAIVQFWRIWQSHKNRMHSNPILKACIWAPQRPHLTNRTNKRPSCWKFPNDMHIKTEPNSFSNQQQRTWNKQDTNQHVVTNQKEVCPDENNCAEQFWHVRVISLLLASVSSSPRHPNLAMKAQHCGMRSKWKQKTNVANMSHGWLVLALQHKQTNWCKFNVAWQLFSKSIYQSIEI